MWFSGVRDEIMLEMCGVESFAMRLFNKMYFGNRIILWLSLTQATYTIRESQSSAWSLAPSSEWM